MQTDIFPPLAKDAVVRDICQAFWDGSQAFGAGNYNMAADSFRRMADLARQFGARELTVERFPEPPPEI